MNDLISRQAAIDVLMELIEARLEWKSDASREINGLNAAYCAIEDLPSAQPEFAKDINVPVNDTISRQAAIDALWKALYAYEDKTERQFIESDELDVGDWMEHQVFVQNMNDIDRQTILELPSVEPTLYGYKIEHLAYIARVMEKEGITAEDAARTFGDLGLAVSWVIDEALQKMEEAIHDHNTGSI